jgi:hypothetical protein
MLTLDELKTASLSVATGTAASGGTPLITGRVRIMRVTFEATDGGNVIALDDALTYSSADWNFNVPAAGDFRVFDFGPQGWRINTGVSTQGWAANAGTLQVFYLVDD